MNTELRKTSKILLAGIVAAGLSVPALAGAAESDQVNNDPPATKALYGQVYDQFKDGKAGQGDSFKLGERDATLCMMGDGYGIRALAVGPTPVVNSRARSSPSSSETPPRKITCVISRQPPSMRIVQ